jgi:UDP-2,3-diacylglucosamine pyrophosphatase LpxH
MTIKISGNKHRALFISDFHLGSPHCKAKRLLSFLTENTADIIYLVGDVLDHASYLSDWPHYHNDILSLIANSAAAGVKVYYIPGNHDDVFRQHTGKYGNLIITKHWVHICLDGRKLLITHGDETDMLGIGFMLSFIVFIERHIPISFWEGLRCIFSKMIENHTEKFQRKMIRLANGYNGVVCGHVHFPKLAHTYMNCGDWVHHCTAIVERRDGSFELLKG